MTETDADALFATLLEESLADAERADYAALRRAYAESAWYLPYGRDQEGLEELHMRIATEQWEEARDLAEELLASDPLSIALRFSYAHVLEKLDEDLEAGGQRGFADGLLRAILRSGDGRSAKTALPVLDLREIQLVLEVLGLNARRSQLAEIEGRWIDTVYAEARGSGREREVCFDVDVPHRWLQRLR